MESYTSVNNSTLPSPISGGIGLRSAAVKALGPVWQQGGSAVSLNSMRWELTANSIGARRLETVAIIAESATYVVIDSLDIGRCDQSGRPIGAPTRGSTIQRLCLRTKVGDPIFHAEPHLSETLRRGFTKARSRCLGLISMGTLVDAYVDRPKGDCKCLYLAIPLGISLVTAFPEC
jgi:hypothetical protein